MKNYSNSYSPQNPAILEYYDLTLCLRIPTLYTICRLTLHLQQADSV
jgi:hypothetical protein